MSHHRTVAAVTAALGQIIDFASTAAVAGATVHYTRPDTTGTQPKVFVYMYQASPNAAARNIDLPTRYAGGMARQKPLVALDLHYLLTFIGDDKRLQPQQMLGSVVSAIHARPVLSPQDIRGSQIPVDDVPFIEDPDVPIVNVHLTPMGLSLDELSKVWSVFFQTPYALSVVYRASVVLVEADIHVRPPLPAQRSRAAGGPLSNPIIAQVASEAGVFHPITPDATLVITGKRLQGEQTMIRFADEEVEPDTLSSARVTLTLPESARVVGVHTVRVVHRPWQVDDSTFMSELASNVASFVVHPRVINAAVSDGVLTVDITPARREEQRAVAVLDQLDADPPRHYVLPLEEAIGDGATLRFDAGNVASGAYAVRVRIDGISSLIEIDEDGVTHAVTL